MCSLMFFCGRCKSEFLVQRSKTKKNTSHCCLTYRNGGKNYSGDLFHCWAVNSQPVQAVITLLGEVPKPTETHDKAGVELWHGWWAFWWLIWNSFDGLNQGFGWQAFALQCALTSCVVYQTFTWAVWILTGAHCSGEHMASPLRLPDEI